MSGGRGARAADSYLHCGVLGPLLVTVDGQAIGLGAAKQRALLATLALSAGRPVPYHRLVDCVWGQWPPATARATLHSHVRRIRLAFGSERAHSIRSVPGGYRLDVDADPDAGPGGGGVQLDLSRFRVLTSAAARCGRDDDVAGEAARLREAMTLWRGPVLADVASETLHREEVPLITEERLNAHERLIDAELRLGRYRGVVAELRELTAEHPLRERFWAQQVIALHGAGRTAEALAAYRHARQRLAQELGLDPGEHLRQLETAILSGRTGLDLVSETIGPAIAEPAAPAAPAYAAPAAHPAIPRQLPPGVGAVVGRDREVGALLATLRPGIGTAASRAVPIALITGRAGVGKTVLAVYVAHLLAENYPDGQLYLDLNRAGAQRLDPAHALMRLLSSLGVDHRQTPDDLDDRVGMFRSIVNGRRVLVVLDNATDEAQVRPLLPGSSSCAVLATSRRRLGGLDVARSLELDVLPPDQALELLRHVLGRRRVAGEQPAAEELARLCGGLPLAVRIAAARLVTKPHWPLVRLVARLREESARLDELVHGGLDIRAPLALSHRALDDRTKMVFHRIALLPEPDFGVQSAAAIADLSDTDTEAALERLVDARLLDVAVPGTVAEIRYRLPDLVRLFAHERARAEESNTPYQDPPTSPTPEGPSPARKRLVSETPAPPG
ncbi:AfsR/SARP family transcriptional regulator [Actinomadura rugatobispora]|uniref:BTAD domain-containing putative transcriptional regulator n=1 Tax=Actinomadura rugatobispora TaxID=1994 RepID=A0ABW1A610_9ACTN|nr:hypothetical protein GCM10010200_082400 [Actinomadura rugatobispora]